MEAYTDFAYVYDTMMKDIPYDEWAAYTKSLLMEEDIKEGANIVELGCGTGSFTLELAKLGYRMLGIDLSADMLCVAKEKLDKNSYEETILSQQDMTDFSLPEKVDAIVSVCDSFNYLIDDGNLDDLFRCAKESLKSNGVFVIDMKTRYFYENVLAYNTMAENFDNCSYIWDNFYHDDVSINEYILTVFVKEGGMYRKFQENHYQRAYDIREVEDAARRNGFTNIRVYDAFTRNNPYKRSERVYFVLKR